MMNKNREYAGIDYFRCAEALLVIAIHTSPLASYSETGDFILTRIAARTAVPFFMITSGYFLISRYAQDTRNLQVFWRKTLRIYGVSILIYLPVNLYNDYFSMEPFLPEWIKDLVFDGTMYHLWYLPASIMGAGIAWYLMRRFAFWKALAVSFMLYCIGLFGDSYYGIAEQIPVLKAFYQLIFQISDYTRNGLFFAPVFFLMGGKMADWRKSRLPDSAGISFRACAAGFCISAGLMSAEAMLLRNYQIKRHDSMYLFLLPCMFFLFQLLLQWNNRSKKRIPASLLRSGSLILYIIHPMMIVALRLAAKVLHVEPLLLENSMIHYISVCLLSILCSVIALFLRNIWRRKFHSGRCITGSRFKAGQNSASGASCRRIKGRYGKCPPGTDRAWIELNVNHLKHNVKVLQKALPKGSELMAVVKDHAYGHGAFEISTQLNRMGIKAFAVATIEEGIQLRTYGIQGEILILGYTNPGRAKELNRYRLTQTLIDVSYAKSLHQQGIPIKTQIKIDTGMHRLGISADSFQNVKQCFSLKQLQIDGIYTHLCCADSFDEDNITFTRNQIEKFYHLIRKLKQSGISVPKLHIQSSYGLLNYPETACDYVRTGIALYGVLSSPGDTKLKLDLRPVLSIKTRIILIRYVPEGESIGYGRSYTTRRESLIAILPIGYGDGIPRNLSGQKSGVLIRGQYAPIVGRICMDQLAVDITDIKDASTGDIATWICSDGQADLSAPAIAEHAGTISNELLCRLGTRLPVLTI